MQKLTEKAGSAAPAETPEDTGALLEQIPLLLPNRRSEVILRRFGTPDEPGGTVLAQEHLRRAQAAVVLISHGVAVGAGVVDDQQVADVDLRQHADRKSVV